MKPERIYIRPHLSKNRWLGERPDIGKCVWLSFCLQTGNSFEVWGYKYVRGSASVQELKDSGVVELAMKNYMEMIWGSKYKK